MRFRPFTLSSLIRASTLLFSVSRFAKTLCELSSLDVMSNFKRQHTSSWCFACLPDINNTSKDRLRLDLEASFFLLSSQAVLPMSRDTSEMSLVFRGFRGIFFVCFCFRGLVVFCLFSKSYFFAIISLYFFNFIEILTMKKWYFQKIEFEYLFSIVFGLFSANLFFIARFGNTVLN